MDRKAEFMSLKMEGQNRSEQQEVFSENQDKEASKKNPPEWLLPYVSQTFL